MVDVFLHVGLPKTGTTSIQLALTDNADRLVAVGTLLPGGRHLAQRHAAYDLLGQRIPGEDAQVAGAFDRLVAEIDAYDGQRAVVSEELLGLARPRDVRRVLRALSGHRVVVVVTVRDLARTMVSAWQQQVVMGGTVGWRDFAAAVRDPGSGLVGEGTGFWLRHGVDRVLDAWGSEVPTGDVRIVTVPPRGAPYRVLLERFGEAVETPASVWAAGTRARNRGLGAVETEVIRRLNHRIVSPLPKKQYRRVIERGIRPRWRLAHSRPLRIPPEDLAWACDRARTIVADLEQRGHPVHGDLADLLPVAEGTPAGRRRLDDVTDEELLAGTESALAALAVAHGRLARRHQRLTRPHEHVPTSAVTALGSAARAAGFRLRKVVLTGADRSRVLAWGVRSYVRQGRGRNGPNGDDVS